ncbi:MAG: tetratricopeptide repeat protein, partial [Caldilineaceae bacterium]|nr:tetratricopeptide repeat protein [Caldilineaceae bacterium]
MSAIAASLPRPLRRLLTGAAVMLLAAVTVSLWQALAPTAPNTARETTLHAASSDLVRWQGQLQRTPTNTYATAQLGLALLQEARVTGDPARYAQAQTALDQALAADPQQIDALVGQGMLALSRHDFTGALAWADAAQAVNPFRADVWGIRVDGLVELGRYPAAVDAAQRMVDLRPGLEAYSRIAYLRELHGDVDGAIDAMQAAVDAGLPNEERTLWSQVQLGQLYAGRGQVDRAEEMYNAALTAAPAYLPAQAGLAQLDAVRGDTARAIARYRTVVAQLPQPDYVIALGDLYLAAGDQAAANAQFELALALQDLNAAAGMDVDLELARFLADHGDGVQRAQAV